MDETTISVDDSFVENGELPDRLVLEHSDGETRRTYEVVEE
jgi:hypothetical protein